MTRPPFRSLRKTTIIVVAVFLGFLIHRTVAFLLQDVTIPMDDSANAELIEAQGVVCSHIVNGSPFGVDSVFDMSAHPHFYSTVSRASISSEDTLFHIWFNGLDTIAKIPCRLTGEACYTSIDSKHLVEGEWSVDFISGKRLLATKQFKVEPSKR